jgi:acyl-CoA synthetase (AMP-forming)/AMP-acid ligase II
VCAEHGVSALFTAPTAIRAIKREDPHAEHVAGHDLSRLRTLFLAGERCDPDTLAWSEKALDRPGDRPLVANRDRLADRGQPRRPRGAAGQARIGHRAVPGYDVRVLDEQCAEVAAGTIGAICVRLPLPPGCTPTLSGSEERWIEAYLNEYLGHYMTGDAGYVDEDGHVFVMSRTDDVINTAGHRLSTGAMEEVLASHRDVAECAVVGVADAGAARVRRAEGRSRPSARRDQRRAGRAGARPDRAGRVVQDGPHRPDAAEDPLGQDAARDDPQDGRGPALEHPADDRGPARAHGDRRRARGARLRREPGDRGAAGQLDDPPAGAVAQRGRLASVR